MLQEQQPDGPFIVWIYAEHGTWTPYSCDDIHEALELIAGEHHGYAVLTEKLDLVATRTSVRYGNKEET